MRKHQPKRSFRAATTKRKQHLINRRVENDLQMRSQERGTHSHGTIGLVTTPMPVFDQSLLLKSERRVVDFSSGAVALVGRLPDCTYRRSSFLGLFVNPARRS